MNNSTLIFYPTILQELDNKFNEDVTLYYSRLKFEAQLERYLSAYKDKFLVEAQILVFLSDYSIDFDEGALKFQDEIYKLICGKFDIENTYIYYGY